jgi:hypothetical protein
MVSPVLQKLIDAGLFERIPATFSTFFFEQIKDWETLFPAERDYFERLFTLIDRLPPQEFDELFSPLRELEPKMGVNDKNWPRRSFKLDQVDFLNRNSRYAEWRAEIAKIFSRVDPVLEDDVRRRGRPRLSIVLSPAELPVGPDRLWTRLKGRRVALESPLDSAAHFSPLLGYGDPAPYDRWVIQASGPFTAPAGVVGFDYDALAAYRQRLMDEVHQAVEKEQIRGPRELGARLKKMKIAPGEGTLASDAVLAEFARAILLAGNGTLLINNTFVEWATIQGIRRARPSITVAAFGVRNKMKPFSSLLIYADQDKTNPIPTQADTLGTYVDLEIFYQYIWQEFEKYAEYQRNTVHIFCADGMDEMLVIAPRDFSVPAKTTPDKIAGAAREWMRL